jgi:CRP/FNR family cyclic AMP-dependent transcriptional regulator
VAKSLHAADGTVKVLGVDPDLATGIDPSELHQATQYALARVMDLRPPDWDPTPIQMASKDSWLGLLVTDGLLLRCVTIGRRGTCELFGPGDLIRPWDADGEYAPLPISLQWRVMQPTRLAVLDAGFAKRISRWPSITSQLLSRVARRARYLALTQAATHLPRVHARLLILFWLLAERWGNVTPDGVRITLPLTHEVLGRLVGAQRPSVTLALRRLEEAGLLDRQHPSQWLLTQLAVERLAQPDSLRLIETGDGLQSLAPQILR